MLSVFLVNAVDETRVADETRLGDVMGWGVQFPSGQCYVEWKLDFFATDERLDHPHVSVYGSISDVEQGTGGEVTPVESFDTPLWDTE